MILIIDAYSQACAFTGAIIRRIDARLVYQTASNCHEGWILTRGCRPWLIVCSAEDPHVLAYFQHVKDFLPKAYLVLDGLPASDEAFNSADAVIAKMSYDALLPHLKLARERREKPARGSARGGAEEISAKSAIKAINVIVETDNLKFVVPTVCNSKIEDFIAQLGKRSVSSVRLIRQASPIEMCSATRLEDGDMLQLEIAT